MKDSVLILVKINGFALFVVEIVTSLNASLLSIDRLACCESDIEEWTRQNINDNRDLTVNGRELRMDETEEQ